MLAPLASQEDEGSPASTQTQETQEIDTLAEPSPGHFTRLAIAILERKENNKVYSRADKVQWRIDREFWVKSSDPKVDDEKDIEKLKLLENSHSPSLQSPSPTKTQDNRRGKYCFAKLEKIEFFEKIQKDLKTLKNLQSPLVYRQQSGLVEVLLIFKNPVECGPMEKRICTFDFLRIMAIKDVEHITKRKEFRRDQSVKKKSPMKTEMLEKENEGPQDSVNIMDDFAAKNTDGNDLTFGGQKQFEELKSSAKEKKRRSLLESNSQSQNSATKEEFEELKSDAKESKKRKSISESNSQSENPRIKKVHLSTAEENNQASLEEKMPIYHTPHRSIESCEVSQEIKISPSIKNHGIQVAPSVQEQGIQAAPSVQEQEIQAVPSVQEQGIQTSPPKVRHVGVQTSISDTDSD